ncbi:MAG: hypothetical protein ACOCP4_06540 [Candidatus Woesearchaeota archaeon]
MNGINLVVSEPDLIDRSIIFEMKRIKNYIEDNTLWNNFKGDKPAILGGMFKALAAARKIYPEVELKQVGRMADFTKWGYAIAKAIDRGGEEFVDAYLRNKGQSNQEILESNPLAAAVIKMMHGVDKKEAMYSKMLNELNKVAREDSINTHSDLWPASPSALSRRLKEIKSNLEEIGIKYSRQKKTKGKILKFVNENAQKQEPKKRKTLEIEADFDL